MLDHVLQGLLCHTVHAKTQISPQILGDIFRFEMHLEALTFSHLLTETLNCACEAQHFQPCRVEKVRQTMNISTDFLNLGAKGLNLLLKDRLGAGGVCANCSRSIDTSASR